MPQGSRTRRASAVRSLVAVTADVQLTSELTRQAIEDSLDRLERGRRIPLGNLVPNPDNPRTDYGDLEPLAASIAERGVTTPLEVRHDPLRPGNFIIIAGSRRLAAARLIATGPDPAAAQRVEALPCLILDLDDPGAFVEALLENMGRKDMTRPEKVASCLRLRDRHDWSAREIARRLAVHHAEIAELLAVGDDPELAPLVFAGRLHASTAAELQTLPASVREPIIQRVETGAKPPTVQEVKRIRQDLRGRTAAARADAPAIASDSHPPAATGNIGAELPPALRERATTSAGGVGIPTPPAGAQDAATSGGDHAAAAGPSRATVPTPALSDGSAATIPTDATTDPAMLADPPPVERDPLTPGAGRLRPALVTLNNLAREIEAFCDRHGPIGFTPSEATSLARAHERLTIWLQPLGAE